MSLEDNYNLDIIERESADKLIKIMKHDSTFDITGDGIAPYSNYELDAQQVSAVKMALSSKVCLITGGPGTGKTSAVLSTILNIFDRFNVSYALCAPTGKAAIQISSVCNNRPASTLHRYFGLMGQMQHRLMEDVLIIDESSMVSADLLHSILELVSPNRSIIFIGDSDQLPPVGRGEPFYQMLQTSIPSVRLINIYRQTQGNGIILAARDINRGISPTVGEGLSISHTSSNDMLKEIALTYNTMMVSGIRDIQILTPVNKGTAGQDYLNPLLRDFMNIDNSEDEYSFENTIFKNGDKVINTRNNYDLGVMNGEVGKIVEVSNKGEKFVETRGKVWDIGLPVHLWVDFPLRNTLVGYNDLNITDLKLAYATTIHKSQGSEYDGVILLMPYVGFDKFCLRQLPYTGVTRAIKQCHIIISGNSIDKYIATDRREERITNLANFINKGLK